MQYVYYGDGLYYYVLPEGLLPEPGQVMFDHEPSQEELLAVFPNYLAKKEEERLLRIQSLRASAYKEEADPLFFKAQRGEATQQEWLNKVAEIKTRYPK